MVIVALLCSPRVHRGDEPASRESTRDDVGSIFFFGAHEPPTFGHSRAATSDESLGPPAGAGHAVAIEAALAGARKTSARVLAVRVRAAVGHVLVTLVRIVTALAPDRRTRVTLRAFADE